MSLCQHDVLKKCVKSYHYIPLILFTFCFMADKPVHGTTSYLKKLEEQLTCAICLDLYTLKPYHVFILSVNNVWKV